MVAVPLVGAVRPSSIRSVVVLPAPLGPRKPVTRPGPTSKLNPSTAVTGPYLLVRWSTLIMWAVLSGRAVTPLDRCVTASCFSVSGVLVARVPLSLGGRAVTIRSGAQEGHRRGTGLGLAARPCLPGPRVRGLAGGGGTKGRWQSRLDWV